MRRERPRDIFPSVSTVNFRRGTKVFTGTLNGERAVIHCPCDIYPGALIVFGWQSSTLPSPAEVITVQSVTDDIASAIASS